MTMPRPREKHTTINLDKARQHHRTQNGNEGVGAKMVHRERERITPHEEFSKCRLFPPPARFAVQMQKDEFFRKCATVPLLRKDEIWVLYCLL